MLLDCNKLFNYIQEKGNNGTYGDLPSKWLFLGDKKLHAVYDEEIYVIGGEPGNWIEDSREIKALYLED